MNPSHASANGCPACLPAPALVGCPRASMLVRCASCPKIQHQPHGNPPIHGCMVPPALRCLSPRLLLLSPSSGGRVGPLSLTLHVFRFGSSSHLFCAAVGCANLFISRSRPHPGGLLLVRPSQAILEFVTVASATKLSIATWPARLRQTPTSPIGCIHPIPL